MFLLLYYLPYLLTLPRQSPHNTTPSKIKIFWSSTAEFSPSSNIEFWRGYMTCTLSKDSTTNSKSLLQSSNKSRAISYSCISTLQNSPFEFISQFVWITLYFTVCSNNMISTEKRKILSEPENGETNKSALKPLYCRHHCRQLSP